MKYLFSALILVCITACGTKVVHSERVNMMVNSYTVDCVGEGEGTCLLVQEGKLIGTQHWEYFYYADSIEGFVYEPGYIYGLQVKKSEIENPPADGSSTKYQLVRLITKEPQ